ncbi:hypothetical protein PITCH_A960005 [uncultured Desulfobacterium sp.]|uniref:Uncharacterized protein n=1 Tax=uncultured Desulfobacterium sp. TaxID=201089 RepID=A0A445N449_9BACT|nr:hypothetical protein PITCH_A960005 [uncultured Desulfobacterium sp.]
MKTSNVFKDQLITGPVLLFSQVLLALGIFIGLIVEAFKGLKQYSVVEIGGERTRGTKKRAIELSGKISGRLPVREFRS